MNRMCDELKKDETEVICQECSSKSELKEIKHPERPVEEVKRPAKLEKKLAEPEIFKCACPLEEAMYTVDKCPNCTAHFCINCLNQYYEGIINIIGGLYSRRYQKTLSVVVVM